jgi:hypothetical protein
MSHIRQSKQLTHRRLFVRRSCSALRTATHPRTSRRRTGGETDSPPGQLAWIVEKFKEWTDDTAELPEHAVDRDQLLTNISV